MSREAWYDADGIDEEFLLTWEEIEERIKGEAACPAIQKLLRELLVVVEEAPGLTEDWCEIPSEVCVDGETKEINDSSELLELSLDAEQVPATCMMCALGTLARKRGLDIYEPLLSDIDMGHSYGSVEMAETLGFPELMARRIIELHEGPRGDTPQGRKERVVKWIKDHLLEPV